MSSQLEKLARGEGGTAAVSAAAEGKVPGRAFAKIAAGLEDAIAYVGGDTSRGRVSTVDVKAVRAVTKLSQEKFADAFRFPIGTLRDWEQGRRQPDSGSAVLLKMIQADASAVRDIIAKLPAA